MKNWIKKITTEYKKSGMNVFTFIYYTWVSDYRDWKLSRARAKRAA